MLHGVNEGDGGGKVGAGGVTVSDGVKEGNVGVNEGDVGGKVGAGGGIKVGDGVNEGGGGGEVDNVEFMGEILVE